MKRFKVTKISQNGNSTKVELNRKYKVILRPFIYIKKGDVLEFNPSLKNYKEVKKVFHDETTRVMTNVKIFPPYEKKELIHLEPYTFHLIFRERFNTKDWNNVKELERFHYRGKGLNKIVGRRSVLLVEIKKYGVLGFGVLSATVPAVKPRFALFETNFASQMNSKLINRIARISRIVIHPEFRGINIGVLMVKHLINYAKEYWDINHFKPIMIEAIAAMTEYHKFLEKAGLIRYGNTSGYKSGITPLYGKGSFEKRINHYKYDFMENQKPKPYLVFPLESKLKRKLSKNVGNIHKIEILPKKPILRESIKFKNVTFNYIFSSNFSNRDSIIKEVFGINGKQNLSTIFTNFSLEIEPGDVVLITGASGSGKSTIIKLITSDISIVADKVDIKGEILNINSRDLNILNNDLDYSQSLINQIKKDEKIDCAIELLNSVGLSEAYLYLKKPVEISDGQKYRFAIAKLCDSQKAVWIADEFLSTLNPEMAAIVSKGFRKIAYRYGATLILSAPHVNFFIKSLLPNKLINLRWGSVPRIYSLKVSNLHLYNNSVSFSIINNGEFPLTNIQIGLSTSNGLFSKKSSYKKLEKKEKINISIPIRKKIYSALKIKSSEGIGEIFYIK